MVDLDRLTKQAQDALVQGAKKLEQTVKDNADRIDGAMDKAGAFAKEKFPDRAAQIDSAAAKAKGAVPRHEGAAGAGTASDTQPTPPAADIPAATPTAPSDTAPSWTPPAASPTPEVDRAARDQG